MAAPQAIRAEARWLQILPERFTCSASCASLGPHLFPLSPSGRGPSRTRRRGAQRTEGATARRFRSSWPPAHAPRSARSPAVRDRGNLLDCLAPMLLGRARKVSRTSRQRSAAEAGASGAKTSRPARNLWVSGWQKRHYPHRGGAGRGGKTAGSHREAEPRAGGAEGEGWDCRQAGGDWARDKDGPCIALGPCPSWFVALHVKEFGPRRCATIFRRSSRGARTSCARCRLSGVASILVGTTQARAAPSGTPARNRRPGPAPAQRPKARNDQGRLRKQATEQTSQSALRRASLTAAAGGRCQDLKHVFRGPLPAAPVRSDRVPAGASAPNGFRPEDWGLPVAVEAVVCREKCGGAGNRGTARAHLGHLYSRADGRRRRPFSGSSETRATPSAPRPRRWADEVAAPAALLPPRQAAGALQRLPGGPRGAGTVRPGRFSVRAALLQGRQPASRGKAPLRPYPHSFAFNSVCIFKGMALMKYIPATFMDGWRNSAPGRPEDSRHCGRRLFRVLGPGSRGCESATGHQPRVAQAQG